MFKGTTLGNVGKDPEVRYTKTNKKIASFSVASTEGKGADAVTTWVTCEAWDKTADIVEQYVVKGSQVYVEGPIKQETWTDKEGKERTTLKITVRELQLCGGRSGGSPQAASTTPAAQPAAAPVASEGGEDNLPF